MHGKTGCWRFKIWMVKTIQNWKTTKDMCTYNVQKTRKLNFITTNLVLVAISSILGFLEGKAGMVLTQTSVRAVKVTQVQTISKYIIQNLTNYLTRRLFNMIKELCPIMWRSKIRAIWFCGSRKIKKVSCNMQRKTIRQWQNMPSKLTDWKMDRWQRKGYHLHFAILKI